MTRQSAVELKALDMLAQGRGVCKYALAKAAYCDQRTAQRILARIHKAGQACVVGWRPIYRHHIPVYQTGDEPDCPKPLPAAKRGAL